MGGIMSGWIKLHRDIENWKYFKNVEIFHLFCTLLLKANHKDGFTADGTKITAGQLMTSKIGLSKDFKMSEMKMHRLLNKLKNEGQIDVKTSTKNTIITITNWEKYQLSDGQTEEQTRNKRGTSEEQVRTNKNANNAKNAKNNKNYNTPPKTSELSTSEVRDAYKKAYFDRYGIYPVWSVKENSLVKKLVASIGMNEAKLISEFYPRYQDKFHASKKHPFGLLVSQLDQVRVAYSAIQSNSDYGNPYTKQLREIERLEKMGVVQNG